MRKLSRPILLATLALSALHAPPALAHGDAVIDSHTAFSAWNITPGLSGLLVLTAVVYARGALRRRGSKSSIGLTRLRHVLFAGGLLALFIALQSPLDAIAERLFFGHQLQHLLLRMVGPMLLVLSRPQAALIAGLPRGVRRKVLGPVLANPTVSGTFSWLTRPWPAFVLFVLSLYVWQVPPIHAAALLNPALHYAMHVTMMLAGFIFFAMIFDLRDSPAGAPYGLRVFQLFATIVTNILLGSLTTLKSMVLYDVYDIQGRLFDMSPLADETAGGFVIWVPSSMMIIIAIILTMRGWNRIEVQRYARRYEWTGSNTAALEFPETAEELRMKVRGANLAVAQGLGLGVCTLFLVVMTTAVTVVSLSHT
ncbi:cytochrome c oxidase assembly protein [Brevirhabdus sp.]|uniref:cytochrome c oxidase assembly protein n=1 Tax=Brevirhabdus sp. TaxID=2004514 RepID=UPI004058922F